MTTRPLRILVLEDVATDAELVEHELRGAGLTCEVERVATRAGFEAALREFHPELILADYSLPGFDGLAALDIAKHTCPEVPFVFVSGAIGEEHAIDTLKQGATDYVLKQRLSRLGPAARRALREAEERAARHQAEAALRRSEERHRTLLQINNALVSNLDRQGLFAAIAVSVRDLLSLDQAALMLYDPERDVVQVCAVTESPDAASGWAVSEFAREGSYLHEVCGERRARIRRDLQDGACDAQEREMLDRGLRSYVAVPVGGQNGVLGALTVASRTSGRYGASDAEFLVDLGRQVALALDNTLAYEQIAQLKSRLEQENVYLQEELRREYDFGDVIGDSRAIRAVLESVGQVAATDTTVLITGETGTGKELVARALHELSPLRHKPLVKVNCAALPPTLIESELFGHERGAFTGAVMRKPGRFELAHGGTIFLDEMGDLPVELQAKLLRVLQEGEFERVGGSQTLKAQVRVIAATNRELETAVREEKFRSDLYYRLNVFPIYVPPLRERKDDIPALVQHLVRKHGARLGKHVDAIPQEAMAALMAYSWPGNVRELENVIERAMILTRGARLDLGGWQPRPVSGQSGKPILNLEDVERQHIIDVLTATNWRVSGERGGAKLLGLKPTTLEARMKKLGIHRPA